MAKSLSDINDEIARDSAAFQVARAKLAALLAPAGPKGKAEDVFIAQAYEVGTEFTLEEAQKDADYFDLAHPLDRGLAGKIAETLREADRLHAAVIEKVASRERAFLRADPSHNPSYFWLGREFTIDPKMETMTYGDTGECFAFLREDDRPKPRTTPSKGRSR
jgi:hypothetical protein